MQFPNRTLLEQKSLTGSVFLLELVIWRYEINETTALLVFV
jgi:hypothetical protein